MKRLTWRKHHKWMGLCICFFMLMFCLSGLVLNHRALVSGVNVSRRWLPSRYHYHNWNGGLMRGTVPYDSTRTLIYGASGMWLTDGSSVEDFNDGLPMGADHRNIRRAFKTDRSEWVAIAPYGLYILRNGKWRSCATFRERLTDAAKHGDTLVVLGRSHVYTSVYPYVSFEEHSLNAPEGYVSRATLFRQMWLLHSGELFGVVGKLVVDAIALVIIALCVTGLIYWLPSRPKKLWAFRWHDKLGRWTIALTLLLCITGWCLRPPMMIPLVMNKTKPLPGTMLSSSNAWNDKLRMIAFDEEYGDWLVSTSEGFYSFKSFSSIPEAVKGAPPVSVMGLNVLQKDGNGDDWLCGSFSGMFRFDRSAAISADFFTGVPAVGHSSSPFGQTAVAGYSEEFASVVEYGGGTQSIPQPESMSKLPMSLWNFALEVHSGRIYIGDLATMLFVFIAGVCAVWCLWSGWKVRRRQ